MRHHLDVYSSARNYDPSRAGVAPDLTVRQGPIEPVLARVGPLLTKPIPLSPEEFGWLMDFVRQGLPDTRAEPQRLRQLVHANVPSGRRTLTFEFQDHPDTT